MKRVLVVMLLMAGLLSPAPPASAAVRFGPALVMVKDLNPGAGFLNVGQTAILGDRYLFSANSIASVGAEPFVSDGTSAGTRLLKDIRPGSAESVPGQMVALNGWVYFPATDPDGDRELWRTDGTTAGTQRFVDILPAGSSFPAGLARYGNRLVFTVSIDGAYQLWVTDGTVAGTHPAGVAKNFTDISGAVYVMGGKAYFAAATPETGRELFVWAGGAAGPTLVRDLNPGNASSDASVFGGAAVWKGHLYFWATVPAFGTELFRTDGTLGGTTMVRDITSGGPTENGGDFTPTPDRLYFKADDGKHGTEVWSTDGSAGGTVMVRDIRAYGLSSNAQGLVFHRGRLYFIANDGVEGFEVWTSTGTASGTRMVEPNPGPDAGISGWSPVRHGDYLYYVGYRDTTGSELWRTDGTAARTGMVGEVVPGEASGGVGYLRLLRNTLMMTADDGVHGTELWMYTITPSRTTASPKSAYARSAGLNKQVVVPVKVTATGTTPIGTVTIKRNGVVWGTAKLVNGVAKVKLTKSLGKGTHTGFSARYSGSVRARTSSDGFSVKVL